METQWKSLLMTLFRRINQIIYKSAYEDKTGESILIKKHYTLHFQRLMLEGSCTQHERTLLPYNLVRKG